MKAARRLRGVVFDLDGTLIDTMPIVSEGLATVVAPYRPRPDHEEIRRALGGPSIECVRRLLGGPGHLAKAHAAYLAYFNSRDASAPAFRGARALLRRLHAAGVPLAIWTGRERAMTPARLRLLGWEQYFDPVLCGDDLATHKPDPEGLLQIVRGWNRSPAECLFVGDAEQDVLAGAAGGLPTLAISHGFPLPQPRGTAPLTVVRTPGIAYRLVQKWILG
jgi:HAD superfamily hydrolase (TIGR01509 family)